VPAASSVPVARGAEASRAETLNQLWARAIIEELVRGGVEHAVVCPGSRSTPLALACADHSGLRTWSVIDERSAAFFALGIGKASGRPALVVATSGTAGAHFYPAAIEAGMAHVPLVLLTADRPPELQGWGAPQTIDQRALYGAHARFWLDVGIPEASAPVLLQLRAQVARAVSTACRSPRGAVHLNVPFREPLAPTPDAPLLDLGALAGEGRQGVPFTRVVSPQAAPDASVLEELAARLAGTERGVIACGPRDQDDGLADAVVHLGRALGYPVLAEAASNVRFGHSAEVLAAYDAILRSERFAREHRPEVVLRLGGGLTPKGPQAWLDRSGAFTVQLSDDGALVDPQHSASLVMEGDPVAACRTLARAAAMMPGSDGWLRDFQRAEARAREVLFAAFAADQRLTEPRIAREVVAALAPGTALFLSSSMPIRDVDAFAMESAGPVRVLANRGANGIDGVTSTALGAAVALGRPAVLLTGDLAFLHDLSGLLTAARHRLSLAVVVVNNDGGGIFSFLPIADRTPHFEALFGTPHGLDLEPAAKLFGARYHAPADARALAGAVRASAEGGLHLIDVKVDRASNVAEHRALFDRVARALEDDP